MNVYKILRQTDMSEGRGPVVTDFQMYESEQDAWDIINDLPGVQGGHPSMKSCYPQKHPYSSQAIRDASNWQEFQAAGGHSNFSVVIVPVVPASRPC